MGWCLRSARLWPPILIKFKEEGLLFWSIFLTIAHQIFAKDESIHWDTCEFEAFYDKITLTARCDVVE